jgi:hypothetical protein
MDALEAENALFRAEHDEIERLRRTRAATAEAELARQAATLRDFAALRRGEETERLRLKEELDG